MLARRRWTRSISASLALATAAFVFFALSPHSGREAPAEVEAATSQGRFSALNQILRLPDLPLGYRLLNFGPSPEFRVQPLICDSVRPANAQPPLAAFLARYSPAGCYGVYFRLFHAPGTRPASIAVGSGAMKTDSTEAAEAGLAVAPELLSHLIGDTMPEEVQPTGTMGDASRLYHWRHPSLFKTSEKPDSSFLVWRSGATVAAVFATGGNAAVNDQAVFELALAQQKRIESPSPVRPSEFDSAEIALEDPALDVPVYWLGRAFEPGHGLPKLRLYDSGSRTAPETLAPRVGLFYTDHLNLNHAEGVFLDLWSVSQWKRLRARGRPLPGSLRCGTIVRKLKLHPGLGSIYDGFERPGRCPNRQPNVYTARLHVGRVVVVARTVSICAVCASAGTGRYDSPAGMEAILRGLVRRKRADG